MPGESQGWEPGGLLSMGLHRVGPDWHDLAAAAIHQSTLKYNSTAIQFNEGKKSFFFTNSVLYLHGKDANGPVPGAMYWYKINSKYLVDLNIKYKYMHLLEENVEEIAILGLAMIS